MNRQLASIYIYIYIHTYNVSRSRLDRNHSNHVVTEGKRERHKRVACCLENANCNVRALSLLPSVFAMRGYFIIALARIHGIHGYIDRARVAHTHFFFKEINTRVSSLNFRKKNYIESYRIS